MTSETVYTHGVIKQEHLTADWWVRVTALRVQASGKCVEKVGFSSPVEVIEDFIVKLGSLESHLAVHIDCEGISPNYKKLAQTSLK